MKASRIKRAIVTFLTSTFILSCSEPETSRVDEFSSRMDFGARGGLPHKTLTLTFDDGPGPRTLELARCQLMKVFQPTFFVLASAAQQRQEVLSELQALGHIVANHTLPPFDAQLGNCCYFR